MAKMLACPYCYEQFEIRSILFRCRASQGNPTCPLTTDPVLRDKLGVTRDLGPVFRADGRKGTANCRACGTETSHRACPACHSRLPVQFGMVGSKMIAMAGAGRSGKTVYMTVVLHELKHRVGERFGAAIMGADEETKKQFEDSYEIPIYDKYRLPQTTMSAASRDRNHVPPLVFRFAARTGKPLDGRPRHTLLSFFDTAGEDFSTQDKVEENTRYLTSADGILLLLDPLQMAGGRRLAIPGAPLPSLPPVEQSPENILSRVTEILLARKRGTRSMISKPIAVVFTKVDAVWQHLDRGSPLRAQPPGGPSFDIADSLDVHEEIRHLLREWQGSQISQILHNNYARYRFFGVSALGQPPAEADRVAPSGIQPYRVADPLLWLLSEFGAIPKTGKG